MPHPDIHAARSSSDLGFLIRVRATPGSCAGASAAVSLRMRHVATLVALAIPSLAAADPVTPHVARSDAGELAVAIAVNPPFRWYNGNGFAGSAYLGVMHHHSIRVNYATFDW